MNKLYNITTQGKSLMPSMLKRTQRYWDRNEYAPAEPRYRLAVLETLDKQGPLTRDEVVRHILSMLIDPERERAWPLRAIRLRQAIDRQFEWLKTSHYIEIVKGAQP